MFIIDDSMKNNKHYKGFCRWNGVTLNDKNYILKTSDLSLKSYKDNKPIYHDTSIYSEHIASTFIRNLGIPCQNTLLCSYKGHDCVLVEDFLQGIEDLSLCTYASLVGVNHSSYTFDEILTTLNNDSKLDSLEREKVITQFWKMFLCDVILANGDRHQGNWGILEHNKKHYVAPIFDNASSLFPQVNASIHLMEQNPKDFYKKRIYMFPLTSYKLEDSSKRMRPNYYLLLSKIEKYPSYKKVLDWFKSLGVHSIDRNIKSILDVMTLPIQLKIFYRNIILLRYLCLICNKDFDTSYDIISKL